MTSVVVPMPMPDDTERLALWRVCRAWWERYFPTWRLVEQPGEMGLRGYWKTKVVNTGVARTDTAVVWMADADVVPERPEDVRDAQTALSTGVTRFAVPMRWVARLDAQTTLQYVRDGVLPECRHLIRPRYRPTVSGGLWGARRDLLDQIGPMSERFSGWGGEDNEYGARVKRVTTVWYGTGDLLHLHHTEQPTRRAARARSRRGAVRPAVLAPARARPRVYSPSAAAIEQRAPPPVLSVKVVMPPRVVSYAVRPAQRPGP